MPPTLRETPAFPMPAILRTIFPRIYPGAKKNVAASDSSKVELITGSWLLKPFKWETLKSTVLRGES